MKIGVIADCHVHNFRRFGGRIEAGVNKRCRLTLDALSLALDRAVSHGCDTVVIPGDLFDVADPGPQVIAEVQRVIHEHKFNREVIVLTGNHDQVSTTVGDHAIGPLAPVAEVVDSPQSIRVGDVELVCLPHVPKPMGEWLEDAIPKRPDGVKSRLLFVHAGVAGPDDPRFMLGAVDTVPAKLLQDIGEDNGMSVVFAGHWHKYRMFPGTCPVYQVGALCPTSFSDAGLEDYGSLLVWESTTNKVGRVIVPGPRFIRLKAGESLPTAPGCALFVAIACEANQVAGETARLSGELAGSIEAGEVTLDDTDSVVAARTAAQEARSATTLESALLGFVEQMPLPEGVGRAQVLAMSKKYLGL